MTSIQVPIIIVLVYLISFIAIVVNLYMAKKVIKETDKLIDSYRRLTDTLKKNTQLKDNYIELLELKVDELKRDR